MKFMKKALLSLLIALVVMEAQAIDVKVDDGETLFASQILNIDINHATNVIHITTVDGDFGIAKQEGDPGDAIVSLSIVNHGSSAVVPLATDLQIQWDVSLAVSCDTTGGGATAWGVEAIVPDGGGLASGTFDLTVDFESQTSFTLNCLGDGQAVPTSRVVNITGVAPGEPAVALLVNGTDQVTVPAESTVDISWDVTNSDACSTSGGNATWLAHSIVPNGGGAANGVLENIPVDFTDPTDFVLTCTRTALPNAVDTVTVNVDANCGIAPLAVGMSAAARSALEVEWDDVFRGNIWPAPAADSATINITRARYMAIRFNTGDNTGLDGGIRSVQHPSTGGSRRGAISSCPGDFSEHLADGSPCKYSWYTGGAMRWTTAGGPQFYECELEPNTTYFLNMTFTDGEDTATDTCTGTGCRTVVDVWHN